MTSIRHALQKKIGNERLSKHGAHAQDAILWKEEGHHRNPRQDKCYTNASRGGTYTTTERTTYMYMDFWTEAHCSSPRNPNNPTQTAWWHHHWRRTTTRKEAVLSNWALVSCVTVLPWCGCSTRRICSSSEHKQLPRRICSSSEQRQLPLVKNLYHRLWARHS